MEVSVLVGEVFMVVLGEMVGQVEVGGLVGEELVVGMREMVVWLVVGREATTDMAVGPLGERSDTKPKTECQAGKLYSGKL